MLIRQSFEQISTPSCDGQEAVFASELRSLVTENQKPLCLLLKSPNMDSAESNDVLLWQDQDVCLIWRLKHVGASHLVSDLDKTKCVRNDDRLNRVENVLSPLRKVMYQENSNFRSNWKLFNSIIVWKLKKKWKKELIQKNIGKRKRDWAWGCAWGINTTSENPQIEKYKSVRWAERTPSWFVLFNLQIFSGGVYPPSATSRTISFSISNSFWY